MSEEAGAIEGIPTTENPPWGLALRMRGRNLDGGWVVGDRIPLPADHTGGYSSVQYSVSRDGDTAFLKVLDYREAFTAADPATAVHALTEAFVFERDVLDICTARGLSKIVRSLGTGTFRDDRFAMPAQYIIFELADHGDLRQYLSQYAEISVAWKLRCAHQMSVALSQLHGSGVAHQDGKPSNTLIFTETSKLGDMGRASVRDRNAPADGLVIPGHIAYAPPELRYHSVSADWNERHLACDLYLLGSLIVFLFTGASLMPQILSRLAPKHRPQQWRGIYEDIEPEVRRVTNEVISDVGDNFPQPIQEELEAVVRYLTDPLPALRGHPKNRSSNKYALERFISILDRMASRAEYGLIEDSSASRAG